MQEVDSLQTGSRRRIIAGGLLLLLGTSGFWWRYDSLRTVSDAAGHRRCRPKNGWSEGEVAAHCGKPDGRGQQIKMFASVGWNPVARGCAPPGDVYRSKAIMYDCDGRVYAVEQLPAQQFVYPAQ